MGNDAGDAMPRVSGGGAPARLWQAYMNGAIDVSLPSFVTTFGRPSSGFFGFGADGGPEGGSGVWYDSGASDQAPRQEESGGFGSMLRYWSTTGSENIKPDNSAPEYNR